MTTKTKSKFQGVTQLRTKLHGPLLAEQKNKNDSLFEWEVYQDLIEDEPRLVDFEVTLKNYGIEGDDERAYLASLAAIPGGAENFLMTLMCATYHQTTECPMGLELLKRMYLKVQDAKARNALYSTNGLPSSPRKGWVVLNALECPLKRFERGVGGAAS